MNFQLLFSLYFRGFKNYTTVGTGQVIQINKGGKVSGNAVEELQQMGDCKSFLEEYMLHLEGGTVTTPFQSVVAMWDFGYDLAGVLAACYHVT